VRICSSEQHIPVGAGRRVGLLEGFCRARSRDFRLAATRVAPREPNSDRETDEMGGGYVDTNRRGTVLM